jgi:hypothetical protein
MFEYDDRNTYVGVENNCRRISMLEELGEAKMLYDFLSIIITIRLIYSL